MGKPRPTRTTDPTLAFIRENKLGSAIAKRLDITRQAISLWSEVPPTRVLVVSEITGLPPHAIRPDLYPPPKTIPLAPDHPPSAHATQHTPAKPSQRNQKVTLA